MVEIEKTAYPRFSKHKKLTNKTLQTICTPSQEEVLMAEQYTKDPHNKFKFLILLKSFQKLGYFLPIEEIPNQIKTHIAGCLQLPEDLEINYSNKKTFHSHKQLIRTLLLINPFDPKAQELAQNIGMERAYRINNLPDIINGIIEELIYKRYELPAYSTLCKIAGNCRITANNDVFKKISDQIPDDIKKTLEELTKVTANNKSGYNTIKLLPKKPTINNLSDFIAQHNWVLSFGTFDKYLSTITKSKIAELVKEAKLIDVNGLKDLNPNKRIALIVCLLYDAQISGVDNLIKMFCKIINNAHKQAKRKLDQLRIDNKGKMVEAIELLSDLLDIMESGGEWYSHVLMCGQKPADNQIEPQTIYLYSEKDNLQYVCKKSNKNETILIDQNLAIYKNIEELIKMQITKNTTLPLPIEYMTEFFKFISKYGHSFIDSNLLKKLKNTIDSKGNIQDLKNLCTQMIAFAKQDHLFLVSQCISKRARNACFNVLHKLQLSSATSNEQTIKAIKFMLNKVNNKGSTLNIGDLDLSFIPVAWQKVIFAKSQDQEVIKDHFEACILSEAVNEFRAGDLITTSSELFSGYKSQLLSKEECSSKINDYCNAVNISATGKEGVKLLKEQLLSTAKKLDNDYPNIKGFTIDNKGNPILSKPKAKPKNSITTWLKTQIKLRNKEKHVLDVLCSTNHLTGWANNFGHVSGVAGRIDNAIEKYILATFSAGTGLGPTQTVKHFKSASNFEVTPHTLSWLIRRHISIAKLDKAIIALNNEMLQYQVVGCWGDGKSCAADGTLRNIYEDNLLAEYHLRYGARGGIAYYHVANNYIAFFASFIPCGVWEAIAILEGLLQNKSEVQPDTVHADTQGQSAVVFALAYLLGIKLMPRIRNWKEYTMFKADKAVVYTNIESLFTRVIDWNLIEECWDDFMQVVLSIKAGTISTTFLLQQLTNYARKNKLLKGLQELGHVIRTLFLIEYLSKIELRAEITATTNKVENFNEFSEWLGFGSKNYVVASNDPNEQAKAIKCNFLMANAMMLQNVIDFTNIILELQQEGYIITQHDVAGLSPYITEPFKRFGIIEMNYQEAARLISLQQCKTIWKDF